MEKHAFSYIIALLKQFYNSKTHLYIKLNASVSKTPKTWQIADK